MNLNVIGIGLLIVAGGGWLVANNLSQQTKGAVKLSARIEKEARATDGRAKAAIKRNEALPTNRILDGWYRD